MRRSCNRVSIRRPQSKRISQPQTYSPHSLLHHSRTRPCQRLTSILTNDGPQLGAEVAAYLLPPAGLPPAPLAPVRLSLCHSALFRVSGCSACSLCRASHGRDRSTLLPTLAALATTSSPQQQSFLKTATSPRAEASQIAPLSQEIRRRNNPVKSQGDPTREGGKQQRRMRDRIGTGACPGCIEYAVKQRPANGVRAMRRDV